MGRLAVLLLASAGPSEACVRFISCSEEPTTRDNRRNHAGFQSREPSQRNLLVTRLVHAIIGAPTIGIFGDIAKWLKGIASGTLTQRISQSIGTGRLRISEDYAEQRPPAMQPGKAS